MKMHPLGAELFHTVRLTDVCTDRYDEADSHFSQFCKCAFHHSWQAIFFFVL